MKKNKPKTLSKTTRASSNPSLHPIPTSITIPNPDPNISHLSPSTGSQNHSAEVFLEQSAPYVLYNNYKIWQHLLYLLVVAVTSQLIVFT
jgi:hypothetical protein